MFAAKLLYFLRSLLVKVALHFSQLPGDFIKLKDTSHGIEKHPFNSSTDRHSFELATILRE